MKSAALFEVGTVFRLVDGVPEERSKVAFAMTGMAELGWTGRREYDFFDAKGVVEALTGDLGVSWSMGSPVGSPFHPSRSAFVMLGGERAGVVGEIHPMVARSMDVPGRIAIAEIELAALIAHASSTIAVRDVPRFPPIRRDLSFAFDEGVASGEVLGEIRGGGRSRGSVRALRCLVGSPAGRGEEELELRPRSACVRAHA